MFEYITKAKDKNTALNLCIFSLENKNTNNRFIKIKKIKNISIDSITENPKGVFTIIGNYEVMK